MKGGDVQVMRAGKGEPMFRGLTLIMQMLSGTRIASTVGIVHDERPHWSPESPDVMRGIQIWVALPHANLNDKPWYQDLVGAELPVVHPSPGVTVKIVFGESHGMSSPILNRAAVWYFDIQLDPHTTLSHPMPADFNVFAHIIHGEPTIAGSTGTQHETFFFKQDGDAVEVRNDTDQTARLLLVGGDPLKGQEVHRYGPFVSTSAADLERTFMNYRRVSAVVSS
jgi:redox-sensitive bicupin YhaK (pirin superfamily)